MNNLNTCSFVVVEFPEVVDGARFSMLYCRQCLAVVEVEVAAAAAAAVVVVAAAVVVKQHVG